MTCNRFTPRFQVKEPSTIKDSNFVKFVIIFASYFAFHIVGDRLRQKIVDSECVENSKLFKF